METYSGLQNIQNGKFGSVSQCENVSFSKMSLRTKFHAFTSKAQFLNDFTELICKNKIYDERQDLLNVNFNSQNNILYCLFYCYCCCFL